METIKHEDEACEYKIEEANALLLNLELLLCLVPRCTLLSNKNSATMKHWNNGIQSTK